MGKGAEKVNNLLFNYNYYSYLKACPGQAEFESCMSEEQAEIQFF